MRQPKFSRRLSMAVDRLLAWCSENMGICAVIASALALIFGFLGLAFVLPWNAVQLGPVSGYLAAVVTFTAVTVALRQSAQAKTLADDALLAAKVRAAIDRDFAHRRETTNQIIAMWTEISSIETLLVVCSAYRDRERREVQSVEAYTNLIAGLHRAASAIFAAQTITLNVEVVKELETLREKLASFHDVALVLETPVSEWREQTFAAWNEIRDLKLRFPQILRDHLPLLEHAEEENERMQELKDEASSADGRLLRHAIHRWLNVTVSTGEESDPTANDGRVTKE